MKVKIGDKVKFLNDIGGGKVVKIIDNDVVSVMNEDGFEIPVLENELIIIQDEELITGFKPEVKKGNKNVKQEIQKPQIDEETEPEFVENDIDTIHSGSQDYGKESDDICIYYAFVPKKGFDPVNSDLDSYLINDSNYFMFYNYLIPENKLVKAKVGFIEPNTKVLLQTYSRYNLNLLSEIHFQFIFYKKDTAFALREPLHKELKINQINFFKAKKYKENDFFHERSIIFALLEENRMNDVIEELTKEDLEKVLKIKEKPEIKVNKSQVSKQKQELQSLDIEVDLHIHELVDNENGLSNADMLQIQMQKFRTELEKAIDERRRKIIFIHGIGNGVLKMELRKELDTKYKLVVKIMDTKEHL